jgi:hypothetical protein
MTRGVLTRILLPPVWHIFARDLLTICPISIFRMMIAGHFSHRRLYMKKKSLTFLLLITAFIEVIILNSCQKKDSCDNCHSSNQPPVARAGPDQAIYLSDSSVKLEGSSSTDPDGSIAMYSWKQIAGPKQADIGNSSMPSSAVNHLVPGNYQFELNVTDNGGLSAKDTVLIIVMATSDACAPKRSIVNARLVPIGTLSQARESMVNATAGTKILFAGGLLAGYNISTRVDIYDFVSNAWSMAELSQARDDIAVATAGNKIFFAGGYSDILTDILYFSRIDIYDALTNTWSTAELSQARTDLACATLGDQVFFAGGYYYNNNTDYYSNRIDIYNMTTQTWSIDSLSEGRDGLNATQVGNKLYFAGGIGGPNVSDKIDIYDGDTHSWSTSNLKEGRDYVSSIAVADKIYWAGGYTSIATGLTTSQVEIRDIPTQTSTLTCLSQAKGGFGIVPGTNEIVFFMGAPSASPMNFDIYNTVTQSWSIGVLNNGLAYSDIISANNKIYVAGGETSPGNFLSNQVSLLEW